MSDHFKLIVKSLKAKFVNKAIRTFDRATMVVVCACWGAAIVMIGFTIYTVSLSASTRRESEKAAASEPILPKIVRKPMNAADTKNLIDRLQHSYPLIKFAVGNGQSVVVTGSDGTRFREWLSALSYIDVISPQYRWTIKELCVGKCVSGSLMHAELTGEAVSFEAPSMSDKH